MGSSSLFLVASGNMDQNTSVLVLSGHMGSNSSFFWL